MYLFERLYKEWKDGKIKQKYMMEKLGVSRSKLYLLIKKHETSN